MPSTPARVLHLERHPGNDFLLDARGELPVVRTFAPARHQIRIVGRSRQDGAEVGVVHRQALTVGREVVQVALRDEVTIGVAPDALCLI